MEYRNLALCLALFGLGCGATSAADAVDCGSGDCGQVQQPFVCREDVPPQSPRPAASTAADIVFDAVGGAIADGTYTTTEARFSDAFASIPGETIEFRAGFYHRNHTTYSAKTGEAMTGFEEAGNFVVDGSDLKFEGTACVAGDPPARSAWAYSVTNTGFKLLKRSGGLTWEESYELRP